MTKQELMEKRAKLVADAQAILKQEKMSKEDEQKFDRLMADADELKTQIDRVERVENVERELNERSTQSAGRLHISEDEAREQAGRRVSAFTNWMRYGRAGLNDQDRNALNPLWVPDPRMGAVPQIRAAQSVGTGSAGGFAVPDELMRPLVEAMKFFGGMRQVSTIVPTGTGADLPIPTDNDTTVVGEIITENSAHNEGDVTLGQVVLQSFLYSSKIVRVSVQLLQDSSFDIAAWLGRKFGQRLGRIQNTHFTTGDGASKPRGVVTASTEGKKTASATAITYDEIVDLMHSVDPAYQANGRFMFNFSTLGAVRKLKDTANMPVWAPMAAGLPDSILGRPYTVNQDIASIATAQKTALYGDFSNYHIRDAGSVVLLRLEERYADFAQVGFLAFQRSDGDLVDAGTNPVKHLLQA